MEAVIAEVHNLPQSSIDERLDDFQVSLSNFPSVDCPLEHQFSPKLYMRKIFMPAITINEQGEQLNTVIISKIHKTTHQFAILQGSAAVFNKADDFLGVVEAPYIGVTPAGTRRILQIIEDCTWITCHVLDYITGEENGWSDEKKAELLVRIEQDLIEKRKEGILFHS